MALRHGELSVLFPDLCSFLYLGGSPFPVLFSRTHECLENGRYRSGHGWRGFAWTGEYQSMKTPLSSILLVLLASLISSFGAVFLKLGSAHLSRGIRGALNWQIAAGIGLFLGSSIPFIMGLKRWRAFRALPDGFDELSLGDGLVEDIFQRTHHKCQNRRAGHDSRGNCLYRCGRSLNRTAVRSPAMRFSMRERLGMVRPALNKETLA